MLQASGFSGDMHSAISRKLAAFKYLRSFKKPGKSKSRKKSRIKRRSTASDVGSPSLSVLSDQSFISNQEHVDESKGNTKYYRHPNTKRRFKIYQILVFWPNLLFRYICIASEKIDGLEDRKLRHSFGEINTLMRNLSGLDFDLSDIYNLSEECIQSQANAESIHSEITLNSSSNTTVSCDRPRNKNSKPVNDILFVCQASDLPTD